MASPIRMILGAGLLLALAGCSSLVQEVMERPDVRVVDAQLVNADLTGANLLVQFKVDNPNGVALVLDRVGYQLRVNDLPFLDGRRTERTHIAARGESLFELPMTIRYTDLLRVVNSFEGDRRDRPSYDLQADFDFDVPVLGTVTVPVRERGDIPLQKLLGRFGLGGR